MCCGSNCRVSYIKYADIEISAEIYYHVVANVGKKIRGEIL